MKICQDHWDALRAEIVKKGLYHLVAKNGHEARAQLADQLNKGDLQPENFDPLMSASMAVMGNGVRFLAAAGYDPGYLFMDPAISNPPEGRNDCPLCELNYLHRESCTDSRCLLDKERGYDWMIKKAVEESYETAKRLNLLD